MEGHAAFENQKIFTNAKQLSEYFDKEKIDPFGNASNTNQGIFESEIIQGRLLFH